MRYGIKDVFDCVGDWIVYDLVVIDWLIIIYTYCFMMCSVVNRMMILDYDEDI